MANLTINDCITHLQARYNEYDTQIKGMETRNSELIKVVATIRSNLERAIKNPSTLNQAVYDSIDLCRSNFKYMDYSTGKFKQDPPLSDEDKKLP
ncbi:MAG: hypothetical protein EBZ62_02020 [Sphingobacteriia bacterium]|nr:hypothetical protein [Sphingobacteriia bacterium]